jgi:hypothetical protein
VNEQEIIQKAITELNSALPGYVAVRTGGGDSGAGPPLCILNWDSTRLNENGQNSLGRIVRDSAGDAIGREFHQYRRMELDVVIRAYDEGDRDTWLSDVAEYFLPYEYDADLSTAIRPSGKSVTPNHGRIPWSSRIGTKAGW